MAMLLYSLLSVKSEPLGHSSSFVPSFPPYFKTLALTHNMDKPKKTCVVEAVNPKAVTGNWISHKTFYFLSIA